MRVASSGRPVAAVVDSSAPPSLALPRTRDALVVLVLGIAGFTSLMVLVRQRRLQAMDLAITMRLQAIHHTVLVRLMAFVSWFGFPPQSRLLPPLAIALMWLARFRLEAVLQATAWGSALISTVIKWFMRRPRPVAGKDLRVIAAELGGTSFPSGHVLTYVGTYGWLAIAANILIRPRGPRRLAVAGLAFLIATVGPSRIYLGHHWPTDVLASYLLGSSYLAALIVVYRRLIARRSFR